MIRLVKKPVISPDTAEGIRILEEYLVYGDIAMFWHQKSGKAVISMLDGDMIISGNPADYEELSSFINALSPKSIFANTEILKGLNLYDGAIKVTVLCSSKTYKSDYRSDTLSSGDVYNLLKKAQFLLPDFEYFAPDFCLRLNRKRLNYFGFKDRAAALCIGGKNILINGLVSLEKGLGTVCINGLLSKVKPEKAFVCAKKGVDEFYIKNGFNPLYEAGYWRQ